VVGWLPDRQLHSKIDAWSWSYPASWLAWLAWQLLLLLLLLLPLLLLLLLLLLLPPHSPRACWAGAGRWL
jgi:hypothetical protein